MMKSFSTIKTAGAPYVVMATASATPDLYTNASEQKKHRRAIEILARDTSRSVWEITPLYENILAHMKLDARIPDYLAILVSKKVKALLQN